MGRLQALIDLLVVDVRFAVKNLRRDRYPSFLAVVGLALGIAAATVVFSIVYGVFFHTVPYHEYDRSVVLTREVFESGQTPKSNSQFSPAEIRSLYEQNHVFEDVIFYTRMRPTYNDGRSVRFFPFGAVVSANTFDYLGVPAFIGRTIQEQDGRPGAESVFVMNYRFWQKEFDGDPTMIGKAFVLNGTPTTLVGVMPKNFDAFSVSFWIPATQAQIASLNFRLMGRLKRGVTIQNAASDLDSIAHQMHRADSGGFSPEQTFPEENFHIVATTLVDSLIGSFQKSLYGLIGAVALLLLIACSNAANLLLARASAREQELAMRLALGASRARIMSQLVMESLVLASIAGVLGCSLAIFGVPVVVRLLPGGAIPDESVIQVNLAALFACLGLTVVIAIACGLVPALHTLRDNLQLSLGSGSKGTVDRVRHGKVRASLVVSEVALSIVLLICAGLLARSFLGLAHVDLGFDTANLLYFVLNLPPSYNTDIPGSLEEKNRLTRRILERLHSLPGVTSAGEFDDLPPLEYESSDTVIPGKPHDARWDTRFDMCSDGYFKTLGVALVRGRLFSEEDVANGRMVMVANEAFSHQYFANEDPLGQKVKLEWLDSPFLSAPRDAYFEIVGIVRDFKTRGYDTSSWQTYPEAFVPYSVAGYGWRGFMARTAVNPEILLKSMSNEVQAIDPGVQIANSGTMQSSLQDFYRGPRFELVVFAVFSTIGLILVLIGVFSVMSYTVSLQTREIGIRMALGAQRKSILGLLLLNGVRLVLRGVVLGLIVSYVAARFLRSQIPGISATDPLTFITVIGLVISTSVLACFLPARVATMVDPLVALRYE